MSNHRSLLPWLALAAIAPTGCSGGPSDQEVCAAIIAVLPALYLLTVGILRVLERLRRAPDRGTGALGPRPLLTASVLTVLAAVAWGFGALWREDLLVLVLIVLVVFGALTLGVSLVVWRARFASPYASRILVAARAGAWLGAPALVLWHPSLDTVAEIYIQGMAAAALLGAIYATPVLLLALILESLVRAPPPAR